MSLPLISLNRDHKGAQGKACRNKFVCFSPACKHGETEHQSTEEWNGPHTFLKKAFQVMRRMGMAQILYLAFPWNQAVLKKNTWNIPAMEMCALKDSAAFFTSSHLQHKPALYLLTSTSFPNSEWSGWPSPSGAFRILPLAGDIMQEGSDNCMRVYTHLHSKSSSPVCAFF